jgi:hypothetical protein
MTIVYVLINEAMPGYIKIGRTDTSVQQRMSELDKTAVPLPFQCYYAARVPDNVHVEKTLHAAFADFRVRKSREFFRMDPYKAQVIIELVALENVTPSEVEVADAEGKAALEKSPRVSGRFNLAKYGIQPGVILSFAPDRSITCEVVDETSVEFDGEIMSLSAAAVAANKQRGRIATALAGPIYWVFQDETLASVRDRIDSDQ